jgi:anti-sigma B factor antagonist
MLSPFPRSENTMKIEQKDGVTIIIADKRMDALVGPKLKDLVTELAQEPGLKLVIDMAQTRFLDSSGCKWLASSAKHVAKNSGVMKIARPAKQPLDILQMVHLDRLFEIHESLESASGSFT